jgi:protease-4
VAGRAAPLPRPRGGSLRVRAAAALVAAGLAVAGLGVRLARADPNLGEARSILRDVDRPLTTVAGEADASATTLNPANLGFLRAFTATVEGAFTAPDARRRGSGVQAAVAVPLPWQIAAIGLAWQYARPEQPDTGSGGLAAAREADEPFGKLSVSLAVPLERWVRGVSLGFGYSRLWSRDNPYAAGVNQVDLAASWWPNRFVALGVVGRGLNQPLTGPEGGQLRQPLELDPELALRPLGSAWLELAAGVRVAPQVSGDLPRFEVPIATPRGRLVVGAGGVAVTAEVERMRRFVAAAVEPVDELKITVGLRVDGSFVGAGLAGVLGTGDSGGAQGGAFRARGSVERHRGLEPAPPRRVTRLALAGVGDERELYELIATIDGIGRRGAPLLIDTQGLGLGWAEVEEVREAMARARAQGAKVAAYVEGGGLRTAYLAAAAERIYAHPQRGLAVVGIRLETLYFGELLARLGAKAEFVRIAEYKGAPEVWERGGASPEVAQQRAMLLTDTWNHVLRTLGRDRGQDAKVVSGWIDEAPLTPEQAARRGAVDELAYADELDAALERWLGQRVRIEPPPRRPAHRGEFGPQPRVAVVMIEGDLLDGPSLTIPLLGRKVAGAATLVPAIDALREDPTVAAIVVRCSTPGGSVAAADAITRALDRARAVKPVVISMGGACASGGYYIATAGQRIVADATTVTGSIGIFYPKVDLSGTLRRFDVGVDTLTYGKRAGLRSWLKPYSADERAAAQADIADDYAAFVGRVAKARSLTPEQVDAVARGRVWSGVRAIEVGLVDEYGGLREAIVRAQGLARLGPRQREVQLVPAPATLLEQVRALFGLRLPNPFTLTQPGPGSGLPLAGGGAGDPSAAAVALPVELLWVLRALPASIWLAERPEPLALSDTQLQLRDD